MANAQKNIANREVCNAIFRDYTTKKPILYVDYANTTTTEVTGESVFAYGGWGHPKRITFNGEKGGTIAFEFQVQPFQLYAIMAGAEVKNTAKYINRVEIACAAAGKLALGDNDPEPVADAGFNIFVDGDDCGADLGEAATYADKEISATGLAVGTTYIVYYECQVSGNNIEMFAIDNTTFPKAMCVDADTIYKNENDEQVAMKMRVYKCQPQSTFTLTHSNTGDPGTLTMTCDMMADADGNILDMIEILPEAGE